MNSTWLHCTKNKKHKIRLICFPHAGGSEQSYSGWHRYFQNDDVEVNVMVLPGRGRRFGESCVNNLSTLIDMMISDIEWSSGSPYIFFGHSMGAELCFELTKRLQDTSARMPLGIIVSGRHAPHLPGPNFGLEKLSDDDLWEEIKQYGGLSKEVLQCEELKEIFVPILRSDIKMLGSNIYDRLVPVECPVFAYGGNADPYVSISELEAWSIHTSGVAKTRVFAGNHFYYNNNIEEFLDIVSLDIGSIFSRSV